MNKNYTRASHGFGPVYDEKSRILILGSFPSVKSREEGFFLRTPAQPLLQNSGYCMQCTGTGYNRRKETFSFGKWHCVVRCHRRM